MQHPHNTSSQENNYNSQQKSDYTQSVGISQYLHTKESELQFYQPYKDENRLIQQEGSIYVNTEEAPPLEKQNQFAIQEQEPPFLTSATGTTLSARMMPSNLLMSYQLQSSNDQLSHQISQQSKPTLDLQSSKLYPRPIEITNPSTCRVEDSNEKVVPVRIAEQYQDRSKRTSNVISNSFLTSGLGYSVMVHDKERTIGQDHPLVNNLSNASNIMVSDFNRYKYQESPESVSIMSRKEVSVKNQLMESEIQNLRDKINMLENKLSNHAFDYSEQKLRYPIYQQNTNQKQQDEVKESPRIIEYAKERSQSRDYLSEVSPSRSQKDDSLEELNKRRQSLKQKKIVKNKQPIAPYNPDEKKVSVRYQSLRSRAQSAKRKDEPKSHRIEQDLKPKSKVVKKVHMKKSSKGFLSSTLASHDLHPEQTMSLNSTSRMLKKKDQIKIKSRNNLKDSNTVQGTREYIERSFPKKQLRDTRELTIQQLQNSSQQTNDNLYQSQNEIKFMSRQLKNKDKQLKEKDEYIDELLQEIEQLKLEKDGIDKKRKKMKQILREQDKLIQDMIYQNDRLKKKNDLMKSALDVSGEQFRQDKRLSNKRKSLKK